MAEAARRSPLLGAAGGKSADRRARGRRAGDPSQAVHGGSRCFAWSRAHCRRPPYGVPSPRPSWNSSPDLRPAVRRTPWRNATGRSPPWPATPLGSAGGGRGSDVGVSASRRTARWTSRAEAKLAQQVGVILRPRTRAFMLFPRRISAVYRAALTPDRGRASRKRDRARHEQRIASRSCSRNCSRCLGIDDSRRREAAVTGAAARSRTPQPGLASAGLSKS